MCCWPPAFSYLAFRNKGMPKTRVPSPMMRTHAYDFPLTASLPLLTNNATPTDMFFLSVHCTSVGTFPTFE